MKYIIKKLELPNSILSNEELEVLKKESFAVARIEITEQGDFMYTMERQDDEVEKTLLSVREKGFLQGMMQAITHAGCVYTEIPVKPSDRGFIHVLQDHLGPSFFIEHAQ